MSDVAPAVQRRDSVPLLIPLVATVIGALLAFAYNVGRTESRLAAVERERHDKELAVLALDGEVRALAERVAKLEGK